MSERAHAIARPETIGIDPPRTSAADAAARRPVLGFVIALLAAIAPYVLLAMYAYPGADDFDYAMDTRLEGYWAAFAHQYLGWNGRFASNVLVLANPMVSGSVVAYKIVAVAMFAATLAAVYAFARVLGGAALDRRRAAACALGWTGVYLSGVPALGENFYWYTGSVTYQLSDVLFIVQAALFVRALARRGAGAATFALAASVVLLLFVVGMNEIVMLLAVGCYATFAAAAALRHDRRALAASLVCLAAALVSGLALALSPGNAVRAALYPAKHDLLRAAATTILQTVRFAAAWATSGALVLATILFVPVARRVALAHAFWRSLRTREVAALLIAPFAVIPVGVFPAVWSTGVLGQHRTVSVAYACFLMLWFVATIAVVARQPEAARAAAPHRWHVAVAAALAAAVAFSGNGYAVTSDLVTGRARRFAAAMEARSAALIACRNARAARCAIDRLADSLHGISVSSESIDAEWAVQSHARYFGVTAFELRPAAADGRR